jgi:hypothetical protein
VADPAGTAMHQHLLAGLHAGALDQAFPGGDEDQRQGGGLAHVQAARLVGQQVAIDGGELGQRTGHAADAAGHAIDFVAGEKRFRQARPPRPRRPGRCRGWPAGGLGVGSVAGLDLGVERIDAAGGDAHQHLAGAQPAVDGGNRQRGAELGEQGGLHEGGALDMMTPDGGGWKSPRRGGRSMHAVSRRPPEKAGGAKVRIAHRRIIGGRHALESAH